ncbi:hypothetical protein AAG570_006051 [Ranatra chinensis]|uniref:Nucleoside diphosphate kinase-like domain-containing protein n=1 Tax=Ranatra chinensis TaxID=642074 RepID=A0ABD0XWW9_9HEMI
MRCVLSGKQAALFYAEHEGKPFYGRLTSFMTSGPIDCYVLAREDAVHKWRALMGPTKSMVAQFSNPESFRGRFGISDTRNATHGSGESSCLIYQNVRLYKRKMG